MLSTIKVDFTDLGNRKGLEPVISVVLKDSEDVRDKLLKSFFQSLGSESSWLEVRYGTSTEKGTNAYITISRVTSNELEDTVKIIKKRISNNISPFENEEEISTNS